MDPRLIDYLGYLLGSVLLTLWVGRTLYRNGRQVLADILGNDRLAESVSRLLVAGFYLLNLGLVALLLDVDRQPTSAADIVHAVVTKLGVVLLILGGLHLMNLLVLNRIRRSRPEANHKA